MKRFLSSIGGKICVICLAVLLTAGLAFGGFVWWYMAQPPHIHDVTLELGQPLPETAAFVNEGEDPQQAALNTPAEQIELTKVGEQTLEFTYGWRTETAVLKVVDTTAPTVTFRDVTVDIATQLKPEDFVTEVSDQSPTQVSFARELQMPESYGSATVDVVVTDSYGNQTAQRCNIFYVWMYPSFQMELGGQVTKADLLLNPERDDALVDQLLLDEINAGGVGEYTITSTDGDQENTCVVTVVDTVAPALEVKAQSIDSNQMISAAEFVVNVSDISGEVAVSFAQQPDFTKLGTHNVTIVAEDINGNVTTAETTLKISYDTTPPAFSGVGTMTVKKHASPDFKKGVSARDTRDGEVTFTCDTSKVDLTKAGTYYVVYSATDSSGNTATCRRKVTVDHDAEDTRELVSTIASKLRSDAEALRDYVRNNISYSDSYGGDDPVWHGFKNRHGNCYVHALCLQALLREKGYQTILIWCQDQSHYWNMVNIDGTWYHMDSTPGVRHTKYSLMNDEQRYELLSGRDWDRDKWPSAG